MSLESPILSLKHMCCQAISTVFWQMESLKQLNWDEWYRDCQVYKNYRASFNLNDWLSSLEVPKTVKEEVYMITFAIGQTLRTLTEFFDFTMIGVPAGFILIRYKKYDGLKTLAKFHDSIALNPTGGINVNKTIQGLLKNTEIDPSTKYCLARHFCVYNPEVSTDLESYYETIDSNGSLKLNWMSKFPDHPQSCLEALKRRHYWAAKYFWSKMSSDSRTELSEHLEEIATSLCQRPLDFQKTHRYYPIFKFLVKDACLKNGEQLLKLLYSESFRRSFANVIQDYFNYYASPIDNAADKFLRLIERSSVQEDAFYVVIEALISSILEHNKQFLYPLLESVLERRTDHFKATFRYNDRRIKSFIFEFSGYNVELASRIILLLRPYDPDVKPKLSAKFMIRAAINLSHWQKPLELVDRFLKRFDDSGDSLDVLKRKAFESDNGQRVVKSFSTIKDGHQQLFTVMRWALGTEHEAEQYLQSIRENIPLLSLMKIPENYNKGNN